MKVPNKEAMDKLGNNQSIFMKVKTGDTLVRVIGEVEVVQEHDFTIGGHQIKLNGRFRAIACPTENARMEIKAGIRQDMEVPPCPICEHGWNVSTKYLAIVLEREYEKDGKFYGGEAYVLKKGPQLLGEVQKYLDDENWGRAGNYDIKITATGEQKARRYSVTAIPPDKSKPLTKREQMAVDDFLKKVSLSDMTTPLSYKQIAEELGEEFPDMETAKVNGIREIGSNKSTDGVPF